MGGETAPRTRWFARRDSEVARAQTAANGTFKVDCGEGDRFQLLVNHAGHAPQRVDQLQPGDQPIDVRLETGHSLDGRVFDLRDSSPVAGASVWLCSSYQVVFGNDACSKTPTDAEGRVRFTDLVAGRHHGYIREPAHEKIKFEVVVPLPLPDGAEEPEPELWFVGPGGTLRGRILTESGEEKAGISLRAEPQDVRRLAGDDGSGKHYDQSKEGGAFELEGLPAGVPFQLVAEPEGFVPLSEGPFTVDAGEVRDDLRLILKRGATVRFRLVDEDGKAVEAQKITVRPDKGPVRRYEGKRIEQEEDGWHTIRAVPAEVASLTIESECCTNVERKELRIGAGEPLDLGTLVLDRGSVISGTVRDSAGKPVADATVSAHWRVGQRWASRRTETDQTGAYRIAGIDEEAQTNLGVRKEGFTESEREDVLAGSSDVDFTLVRSGTIAGAVLHPDGSPATEFKIEAHRTDATSRRGQFGFVFSEPARRSYESADGKFTLAGLDAGTYTVIARAQGFAPGRLADLEVESDAIADAGRITLRPGLALSGRVVTADEEPIPGAAVSASKPETFGWFSRPGTAEVATVADLDGNFVLEGLESGVALIRATHSDYPQAEERVELVEGEEPPLLLLVLSAGGRLTGMVRDREGRPIAGAEIVIQKGLMTIDPLKAKADATGRYAFDKLAPGTYTAMRMAGDRGSGPFAGMDMKTVQVEEGETAVLDFETDAKVELSGRVLRGGEPVPGVTLMFLSGDFMSGQPSMRTTQADEQGRYEVGLDRGGTYQVSILGGESPGVPAVVKLEVPDEKQVVRDLELEDGGVIEGVVTDEEGRPLERVMIAAAPAGIEGVTAIEQLRQALTTADGRYTVRGLQPGALRVTAVAQGHAPAEQTVTLGEEPLTVNFELEPGAMLRGRVVDSQGNPVMGAVVVATPAGSGMPAQGAVHSTSGLDGRFEVAVPSGTRMDVAVMATGWAPAMARDLVADERDTGSETVIRVTAGGRLHVTVTGGDGRPVSGVNLSLDSVDPSQLGMSMLGKFQQRPPTNSEGAALMTLIAPGTYRVSAMGRSIAESPEVTIHEGQESAVHLMVVD